MHDPSASLRDAQQFLADSSASLQSFQHRQFSDDPMGQGVGKGGSAQQFLAQANLAPGLPYGGPSHPAPQLTLDHMGKGGGKGAVWNGWGSTGWDKNFSITILLQCLESAGAIPDKKSVAVDGLLFVKGLPIDTTDLDLYKLFSPFGPVSHVRAFWNEDGTARGIGFVHFLDAECASMAIKVLHNTQMSSGQILTVEVKAPRKAGQEGTVDEEALLKQAELLQDQLLQQQLLALQQQQALQEQQAQLHEQQKEIDEAEAEKKKIADEAEKQRRLGMVKKRAMDVIRGSHLG